MNLNAFSTIFNPVYPKFFKSLNLTLRELYRTLTDCFNLVFWRERLAL